MIDWEMREIIERHRKKAHKEGFINGFLSGISLISVVVILNIFFGGK